MKKHLVFLNFLLASFLFFLLFFWQPHSVEEVFNQNWHISTVNEKIFFKKENQNKILMLYFGYTFCPDVCPSTLLEVAQALENLPDNVLNQMEVLFVSLDPLRDKPSYLAEYVRFFHPKIKAGLANDLKAITQRFGVVYYQHTEEPFLIDHSADTILVAPKEKTTKRIAYGAKALEFQQAVLSLIH